MKIPKEIDKVSVSNDNPLGPYPSLGFVPISEAALGNGDYYGLYWPLGKESQEPLICDMLHDEWSLELSFSSLAKFIQWLELNDWERGDEDVEDYDFAPYFYTKAREALSEQNVERSIELFRKACESFSEVSSYWASFYSQLQRVKDLEGAAVAALSAFNSNWVFGAPPDSIVRALRNPKISEIISEDPVVKRISEIDLCFGGRKENSTYDVLKECYTEYLNNGQPVEGLMLYQNYAYAMYSETVSFQERYNFVLEDWRKEFSTLCSKHLEDNRVYQC